MKRALIVVAAGTAIALAGFLPAHAGAPSVSMSNPASGATLSTATPAISGTVSATSPSGQITGDLQLSIASSAGHPGWSDTVTSWCGHSSCTFSIPVSPALAYNGSYTLSVQAEETDSSGSAPQPVSTVTGFSLAAPPAAPSGLTATPASDGSSVSLTWQAEQYPDLVGYQVARTPTGPGFPASISVAHFADTDVSPGTSYSYAVTAVRRGASSDSTVSSPAATTTSGSSTPPAGSAPASPDSGPAASGSPSTSSNAAGLGHYGSAGSSSASGSTIEGLLHTTSPASPHPGAQAAPAVPAPPPGPADGVAPGSDNPAVAPFSSGNGGFATAAGPGVTITYTTNHAAVVRDYAAVALAALLLAIAAHLLWVRRQLRLVPAPVRVRSYR